MKNEQTNKQTEYHVICSLRDNSESIVIS